MLGAIAGDVIGSRFEFSNIKSRDFDLFLDDLSFFTDDTVLTLAVAKWLPIAQGQLEAFCRPPETSLKRLVRSVPTVVTTAMMTTAIRPYSMAATPD